MKRLFSVLLMSAALLLAAGSASGETTTFTDAYQNTFVCTDLTKALPKEVERAFAPFMREGDKIVSGVYTVLQSGRRGYGILVESAMMAVLREDTVLLLGARKDDSGVWHATLETDSFIPAGVDFSIEYLPGEYHEDGGCMPQDSFAIVMDEAIYRVYVYNTGCLKLSSVEYVDAGGTRMLLDTSGLGLFLFSFDNEDWTRIFDVRCGVTARLAAHDMADFPRTVSEMEQYAAAHQPVLSEGQAFISGVNLREKPTGQSRSLGKYSARVKVLGSQPGVIVPWYNVRVGDTEGWVSGDYLIDGTTHDIRFYSVSEMTASPARAQSEVTLYMEPDGDVKQTLSPGTLMNVIVENDGWLHVIIPRREITAFPDWDGTYGYVRAKDVTRGETLAELKWK